MPICVRILVCQTVFFDIVFRTGRHGATLPAGAFAGAAEASGAELRVLAFQLFIETSVKATRQKQATIVPAINQSVKHFSTC